MMDAEHQAHLKRILENRRKRGIGSPSMEPPQPSPPPAPHHAPAADKGASLGAKQYSDVAPIAKEGSYSEPVPVAAAAPPPAAQQMPAAQPQQESRKFYGSTIPAGSLDRQGSSISFQPTAGAATNSTQRPNASASTTMVPSEMKMLVEQNRRLQQNQLLQEKRIEALQSELRGGFSDISNTIRTAMTPQPTRQQSRPVDPRESQRRYGQHAASQLIDGAYSGSNAGQRQYPLPTHLENALPVDEGPMMVPFRAPASTRGNPTQLGQATDRPRQPPIGARPFTTSTIDIDSSVTILRSGDWFLKWNKKGSEVHPRYVWLDTSKYILSWGKQKGAPSVLSGSINIEQIQGVTTSQTVEYEDDVARVFFILVIHTPTRQVYLATERREKLDTWYDALNNIAMFYRSHGVLVREEAPNTE